MGLPTEESPVLNALKNARLEQNAVRSPPEPDLDLIDRCVLNPVPCLPLITHTAPQIRALLAASHASKFRPWLLQCNDTVCCDGGVGFDAVIHAGHVPQHLVSGRGGIGGEQ